MKNKIKEYNDKVKDFTPEKIIKFAHSEFDGKLTFATSLGEEDQVILDMISKHGKDIEVFTLDTGRLFKETLDLIAKTQKKYTVNFKIYYPDTKAVEDMVTERGMDLFYESVENRKFCCGIRKVEPLKRALANFDAWIVGLRRAQSVTRSELEVFQWDEINKMVKISPLANWTHEDVKEYIVRHSVDVNPLHAQGFASIGCAPCTRAVKPGGDVRSGRWWWEKPEQKECGLHKNPNRPKFKQ